MSTMVQVGYVGSGGGSGGTVPSGTGFRHVTSGTEDGAAVAVTLSGADVTGTLPLAKEASPTSTGFAHVTSGAWDAAARAIDISSADVTGALALASVTAPTSTGLAKVSSGAWVAAAATLVNADVNAAAAIAGTKISPDFGSQNVTTTGFISVGASPAATGLIRSSADQSPLWAAKNHAGTQDYTLIETSTTDSVYFCSDASFTSTKSYAQMYCRPTSAISLGVGNTEYLGLTSSSVQFTKTIKGVNSSAPFGTATYNMASDADATPTSTAYVNTYINVTSTTLTATRGLLMPNVTGALYAVTNSTTGAQSITVKKSGGTGVTIANGKTAWVIHNGTDYVRLTADV